MKLISDLKVGDKAFVINKHNCTFDVAEVIELSDVMIRFQCYFNNEIFYLWKRQESKCETFYWIIFIDENEAIETFKQTLYST